MKLVLTIWMLLLGFFSYSQIDRINILIGQPAEIVTKYLDSLNNLKPKSKIKIVKNISDNGNLEIINDFSLDDQDFYKCASVSFIMERIAGVEVCVRQIVAGGVVHAFYHLNYIKDNFNRVSDNKWEFSSPSLKWKIEAVFEKRSGVTTSFFFIIYNFKLL